MTLLGFLSDLAKAKAPSKPAHVPPWTPEQTAFVHSWTEGLLTLGRSAFIRGTVSDVVAWQEKNSAKLHVAFVGDPLKWATEFGYLSEEIGSQRGSAYAYWIQNVFGVDLRREIDRDIQLADFLSRLEGQVSWYSGSRPFDDLAMNLLFSPGYPWPSDDDDSKGFSYWSAKAQKWITPERPPWLLDKPSDTTDYSPKVNPCAVFPVVEQQESWPLWGRSSRKAGKGGDCGDLLVCHATTLKKDSGALVHQCGGFLFPSISVGCTPASNFGPITFVGHLGLVLEGLKPNKSKNPSCWVYDTDAWTVQTPEITGWISERLFEELHGHQDFSTGRNFWILGPPKDVLTGRRDEGYTPLESVKALVKAVRSRGAVFPPGMTREEFEVKSKSLQGTDEQYYYCEAKGRRVISLDEFPALIAPDSYAKVVSAFVKETGYAGRVVLLPDTLNLAEDERDEYKKYQWSWIVAQEIRSLAPGVEVIG